MSVNTAVTRLQNLLDQEPHNAGYWFHNLLKVHEVAFLDGVNKALRLYTFQRLEQRLSSDPARTLEHLQNISQSLVHS